MNTPSENQPNQGTEDDARLNRDQEREIADAIYKDRKGEKYMHYTENANSGSTGERPKPQPSNEKRDKDSKSPQAPQLNRDKKDEQNVDPQEGQ